MPTATRGEPSVYLCGHSLGLQPTGVPSLLEHELGQWGTLGIDAYFRGPSPWYHYHETVREPLARLVGAKASEVVAMNGLTVNLHLMLTSFYRPTNARYRILIEEGAFPSDRYAVQSQIAIHGLEPDDGLLVVKPRQGERLIRMDDLERVIEEHGTQIALVLLPGVQYQTGQVFDVPRITSVARRHGCQAGFDLAHAVGNVPLRLHAWDVDFAVWCSYKYLNSGPGAVAGCFVHDRCGRDPHVPRLAGWWGTDPGTRFEMQPDDRFAPHPSAAGWQISNPPILAMAPLRVSLQLFDEVGMSALRSKSILLTGYLEYLLRQMPDVIDIVTPADPAGRGSQLSCRLRQGDPRRVVRDLSAEGIRCDFREPDVIRVAPVPLYNSFDDVWRFARALTSSAPQ